MEETFNKTDGYSFMDVTTYGFSSAPSSKHKYILSDWVAITFGIHIAFLVMDILNIDRPAEITILFCVISMVGLTIDMSREIWIKKHQIKISCGDTHLPILVNYINRNVRFSPKVGEVRPLQIFRDKYRCELVQEDGKKTFHLTGIPTNEMKKYVRHQSTRIGIMAFFISRITLVYVCSTDGEDQIGDVLESFSAEKVTHIQPEIWTNS